MKDLTGQGLSYKLVLLYFVQSRYYILSFVVTICMILLLCLADSSDSISCKHVVCTLCVYALLVYSGWICVADDAGCDQVNADQSH